ncbi:NAD(P)-dependent oxidoreductase [Spirillospora sp. NBC_00431]
MFRRAGYAVLPVARRAAAHVPGVTRLDVAGGDPEDLARLLVRHDVDVVVNATGGWVPTEDEMRSAHVHLVGNLLTAVAGLPRRPRIVQIGSIHEYGPVPAGTAIHEETEPGPRTPYARTKAAGSAAVLSATEAGEVDGVVLRAVNVCGPHTTTASFLGGVAAKLRAAGPGERIALTIAEARRDYIDVRDVAEAVLSAAVRPVAGQAINIGRGEAVSMRDLVSMLLAAAGRGMDAVDVTGAPVESKGGGWTMADISRARRLLGWRPRRDLRASIQDMWDVHNDRQETP